MTASYDASKFTLTLEGKGGHSTADMQSALRAVQYKNTTDEPFEGTRTVEFVALDFEVTNAGGEL